MKQLPESPNLEHLKKQAKDLQRACESGDAAALTRVAAVLPKGRAGRVRLHDAQWTVAREYGFASWTEMRSFVEWSAVERANREQAMRLWFSYVYGGGNDAARPKLATRLLDRGAVRPGGDVWMACAMGDEAELRRAIEENPAWVKERGGPFGMTPLIALTHSGLLRDARYAPAMERCAALLLNAGADVNETWIDATFPDSPLGALYGAAGKNHAPGMTRLLLERGADPNDNESLYHSVESADLSCTKLLLESGVRVDGTNALCRALDFDRIEAVRLLLEHGGDPNHPGYQILPVFHGIRRGRSAAFFKLMLEHGLNLHVTHQHGMSPSRFAALFGLPEVAALLRVEGEEPLSKEESFLAACTSANRAEATRLLKEMPGIFGTLTEAQLRLLPDKASQGELAAVKVMVEMGWPVAARGGDWNASALNLAVFRGDAEMTAYLLDHGASWEERHGFGGNVMGTLGYGSSYEPAEGGVCLACAELLVAHGMPLPTEEYNFSEEVTEYFEGLKAGAS